MEAAYQRWALATRERDMPLVYETGLPLDDLNELVEAAFDDAPEMVQRQAQQEMDIAQRLSMFRRPGGGVVPAPVARRLELIRAELDMLRRDNTEERIIADGGDAATYTNYLGAIARGDIESERSILHRMRPQLANLVERVTTLRKTVGGAPDPGAVYAQIDDLFDEIQRIEGTRIKPARPTASSAMIRQALRDHRGDIAKAAAQVMRQL